MSTRGATSNVSTDVHQGNRFDNLLPVSYRTPDDEIELPALTTDFLWKELGVKRLNDIHRWLWLVGRPMPPRSLGYQRALNREIIIHEQMDLHLVWQDKRMYLKPIPEYLLDKVFWETFFHCDRNCSPVTLGGQSSKKYEDPPQEMAYSNICERCKLRRCAVGFMLSYVSLISYKSDLRVAKDLGLVPEDMGWNSWRAQVKALLASKEMHNVNPRFRYGELRMDRLNMIYKLTFRSPIRGYFYGYRSYHHFWHDNLLRVASVFAYLLIVLTAMQVGLGTNRLKDNEAFQRASSGFTALSIIAPLALMALLLLAFFVTFLYNLLATLKYRKRRFAAIEKACARSVP